MFPAELGEGKVSGERGYIYKPYGVGSAGVLLGRVR
jgi:hypothetical protein